MTVGPPNPRDLPGRWATVDPLAFFERAAQAFAAAELALGGAVERWYHLSGLPVRVRFAGPTLLAQVTPALAHLATAPEPEAALTICAWDTAATGVAGPPLPRAEYALQVSSAGEKLIKMYTPRGDIRGYNNGRIQVQSGADLFSLLDHSCRTAIYWCQDAAQLPLYERGAPFRSILHWALRPHGRQLLHAGAVGTSRAGVLLAGKGGSGKSTTALACLSSELLFLCDDYCLVSTDPIPYAHPLYSSAKVNLDNLQRVPHLAPAGRNEGRFEHEKALFFLAQQVPEKLSSGFPLSAILLPRLTGRVETTLTPASPLESLKALTLSTLQQLAGAGQAALQTAQRLVERTPGYHLELGTDLTQIPPVIAGLLATGRA